MRHPFLPDPSSPPRGPAILDPVRGVRLSYPDLRRAVHRDAARLVGVGAAPGSTVALIMDEGPRSIILAHATWSIGATLAPLHRREPDGALAARIDALDPDLLVGDEQGTRRVRRRSEAPVITTGEASGNVSALADAPSADPPRVDSDGDRPALLLFTSGTTGTPKAVLLSAANLRASARASDRRLGHTPSDRWLDPLPFYHMGGLAPIVRCGLNGSTVVVAPSDPDILGRVLREHRITGASLVPTQLRDMLEAGIRANRPSLRFLLVGGAPTPPALLERCRRHGIPVHPTYGTTETASQVATATPRDVERAPTAVGRPLRGVRVSVLDAEGNVRAPGEPGEIVVGGPTVMLGYRRPDGSLDRSRIGPHGFRTGDRGHLDAGGFLHVKGRGSDRITTGGETVDPEEVRRVLMDHRSVGDAAVVGLDHPRWGQQVAALLESAGESPVDRDEIVRHCEDRLADFKRPGTIAWTDALPRTDSGTVDRRAVRKAFRARAREDA